MLGTNGTGSINDALTVYFERLDQGERIALATLCEQFPSCAEELKQFFASEQKLHEGLKNFSTRRATGSSLSIRCPNCRQPTQVAADTAFTDITCESCGSQFGLVDQANTTTGATPLLKMGRFELVERLGMGAFGSVWKARDTELDRTVAVKIPRQAGMSPEEQEKFLREARAVAQLKHPNIVSVHEVGRDGDSIYIVSDFVRGLTLADWLTGQQPSGAEAARLCARVADALHHAHEKGVVHRDLKPANIMLDGDLAPHIMDFGLARRDAGEVTVTVEGHILGTPAYMSPEQARGEAHAADRRSDVYSLGVILFQLLTGELPFRGNARMLVHQVIHDEAPSPRKLNANIKRDLETITLKCLEKDPTKRYQTASDLADELRRFLAGEPIHARPIGRIARSWRWAKRKPAIATLWATVFTLTVGTIAAQAVSNERVRRESSQKDAALEAKKTALNSAEKNLAIARRSYYAAQMHLASQAWYSGHRPRTVQILEAFLPKEGEPDLRGFEWRHLYHLCNANVVRRWRAHPRRVVEIVWPREAHWFASNSSDGPIRLWNGDTGEAAGEIPNNRTGCQDLAVSPDGQLMAGVFGSGEVVLWDVPSKRELRHWKAHPTVLAVAISPDKKSIVTAGDDDQDVDGLALWEIEGHRISAFSKEVKRTNKLALSPDGSLLGTFSEKGAKSGSVTLWRMGAQPERLREFKDIGINDMAFSGDGQTLWCACSGKLPELYEIDIEQGVGRKPFPEPKASLTCVAALSKQRGVVTAGFRSTCLWNADNGTTEEIGVDLAPSTVVVASPNGHRIVSGDVEGRITLRDLDPPPVIPTLKLPDRSLKSSAIRSIAYSPDGKLLYVGHSPMSIVDAETLRFRGAGAPHTNLAIANDCQHAASYDEKTGKLDIWNIAKGSADVTFDVGQVDCALFSPDGRFLATWKEYADEPLKLWDTRSGAMVTYPLESNLHKGAVTFSPHHNHLAMGCASNPISIWDIQHHVAIDSDFPPNDRHRVVSMAYSPDGTFFAATAAMGDIYLWDVDSQSGQITFRSRLLLPVSRMRLGFSPDSARLVTTTPNSLRLWDIDLGQETMALDIDATLFAFSPQGDRMAIVGEDNKVRILKTREFDSSTAPSILQSADRSRSESLQVTDHNQIHREVTNLVQAGEFETALQVATHGDENVIRVVMEAAFKPECLAAFEPKKLNRFNLSLIGDIRMVAGDAPAAEEALRSAPPPGYTCPHWYYSSLGWCLLAQDKKEEARQAFEQCLQTFRQPNGGFDLSQADDDHMTAAYFLDLISEQQFIKYSELKKEYGCVCWFYIGQRREIEGQRADAMRAYERCLAILDNRPRIRQAYAQWRLYKLRAAEKGQKTPAAAPTPMP